MALPPYPPTNGFEPCATTDPELFFPERGGQYVNFGETAKALCRSCHVRLACAEYAIATDVEGIWGGTDERERRAIQKEREIEPIKLLKAFAHLLPN